MEGNDLAFICLLEVNYDTSELGYPNSGVCDAVENIQGVLNMWK